MTGEAADASDTPIRRSVRTVLAVWAVFLVLSLFPLTQDPAGPIKHLVSDLTALVAVALSGWGLLRERDTAAWRSPVLLALPVFLGVFLAAALLSEYPRHSLEALRPWFSFSLIALAAAYAVRDGDQAWGLIRAFTAAAVISSVYGFAQALGMDPFPWSVRDVEEYRRLPATFANPNFAGHALAPILALLCAYGAICRRAWVLLPLAVLGAHLYLTGMRGAPLALVAAAVFAVALAAGRQAGFRPAPTAWTLIAAGLAAGLAVLAVTLQFAGRHDGPLPLDGSLVLRLNGYFGAAEMAQAHPLTGVGPGNYPLLNAAYWREFEAEWFLQTAKKNFHVHNDLLEAAVEGGVPGTVAYGFLFLMLLFGGLALTVGRPAAARALGWGTAAVAVVVVVDGLFGFPLRVPVSSGLVFVCLGLVAGVGGGAPGRLRWQPVLAAVLAVAALGNLSLGAMRFWGEIQFQRGLGALAFTQAEPEHDAVRSGQVHGTAMAYFDAAARALSWSPRPFERAAATAFQAGDWETAMDRYTVSLARSPDQPNALVGLALAALHGARSSEDVDETLPNRAAVTLEQLEALMPLHPEIPMIRGAFAVLAAERGDDGGDREAWVEAARAFEEALSRGHDDAVRAYRELARARRALGDPAGAEAALAQGVALGPDDGESWRLWRELLRESDDTAGYREALNRAWRTTGKGERAYDLARFLHTHDNDPALARAVASEGIAAAPAHPGLWAYVALLAGDDAAAVVARRAEALPEDAPLPEAVAALREGLGEDPDDTAAMQLRLGELFEAAERYGEAAQAYGLALAGLAGPERGRALTRYSAVLAEMELYDSALDAAREAYGLLPGSVAVEWNLARRLEENGLDAEARFAYQGALRKAAAGTAEHARIEAALRDLEARMEGGT